MVNEKVKQNQHKQRSDASKGDSTERTEFNKKYLQQKKKIIELYRKATTASQYSNI